MLVSSPAAADRERSFAVYVLAHVAEWLAIRWGDAGVGVCACARRGCARP